MIKTVLNSQAKKTTGCAVTYRAGSKSTHGTCPTSCKLMSGCKVGTNKIDAAYVRALSHAVPAKGIAFTYTHFAPSLWRKHATGKTVINYSADSLRVARNQHAKGIPSVAVVPRTTWNDRTAYVRGKHIYRCPAEYELGVNCRNCGNGRPLCARPDRSFIIAFTAHGNGAARAESSDAGGCYAEGGRVALHWRDTVGDVTSDAERVTQFAKQCPPFTVLRHHVAGDIGREL